MRIDWRTDPAAPRARVVDADTGEVLPLCVMADEEAGMVERCEQVCGLFVYGPDGRVLTFAQKRPVRIEFRQPDGTFVPARVSDMPHVVEG